MNESLVDLNGRFHDDIEALMVQWLVALTALDLVRARALFDEVKTSLEAHRAAEEDVAVPLYRGLLEPRSNLAAHVMGDHTVLVRSLADMEEAIGVIEASDESEPRLKLVDALPVMARLRSIWTHHTLREQSTMYPLLDEKLGAAERARVAKAIFATDAKPPRGNGIRASSSTGPGLRPARD